jgi:septum formation topological specificity factor MinE
MCHLVMDSANEVQKMAYQMLREAAKKYTEDVVVEAAVDAEGAYHAVMPTEVLDILSRTIDVQEETIEVKEKRTTKIECSQVSSDFLRLFTSVGTSF